MVPKCWCFFPEKNKSRRVCSIMDARYNTHQVSSLNRSNSTAPPPPPSLHEVPTGSVILCEPGCKETSCSLNPPETVWHIVVYKLFNIFTFKSLSEQHFFVFLLPCFLCNYDFWCDKLLFPPLWKKKVRPSKQHKGEPNQREPCDVKNERKAEHSSYWTKHWKWTSTACKYPDMVEWAMWSFNMLFCCSLCGWLISRGEGGVLNFHFL